jgi:hypothetical protein
MSAVLQVHSLEKAQGQMPTLNEVVSQCTQVLLSRTGLAWLIFSARSRPGLPEVQSLQP